MLRTIKVALLAACAAALALATTSGAGAASTSPFPACYANEPAPVLLSTVKGAVFEGLAIDGQGRLYASDLATGNVYRWDTPTSTPIVITKVPTGNGAGALAMTPDGGSLLIGYASTPSQLLGDVTRSGHIEKLNLGTGAITQVASGLSAADGIAVAADGTIYATNDFGDLVGRVSPDGTVNPTWGHFPSANGAVLSADGKYLYVSRTFVNPGVSRIPVADPDDPQSLIDLTGPASFEAFDGLTLDSQGRAVVPTDLGGEIVRVDGPGQICHLSAAPNVSSVIAYGHGASGFSAGNLYRAGFDGDIYAFPAAYDAGGR